MDWDPLIGVRWVHFSASLIAAGTASLWVLAAPDADAGLHRRFRHLAWVALAVAILSGALWLLLVAANILDVPFAQVWSDADVWTVATGTHFGRVTCLRLVLALTLGLLMFRPSARWLTLVAAAAFVAPIAAVGHAGAALGKAGEIHLVSDIVHLLAAGAWLGALPAYALLLGWTQHRDWGTLAVRATQRFSLIGVVSVAALLASGLVNSWNLLGGPRDLIATDYGRLVLVKIVLFAAMVAVATVNKFRLTPRLPASSAALRRNTLVETGLGLAVLLAVGALGLLPPTAHVHPAPTDLPAEAAFVHIHDVAAMADVTVDPGRPGPVHATVRLSREDFSEFPAKSVSVALDPPAPGGKSLLITAAHTPDGTWQTGDIDLAAAGVWTVKVIVTPETGNRFVLDGPIVIEAPK